jgi:hypothetical protein
VTIVIDVDYLGYRALLGYDDEGADNPGSVTLTARTITTKRLLDWVMAPENDVTITAESITLSQRLLDVRIGPG